MIVLFLLTLPAACGNVNAMPGGGETSDAPGASDAPPPRCQARKDDAKYTSIAHELPSKYMEVIPWSGHDPRLEQPQILAEAISRAVYALAE